VERAERAEGYPIGLGEAEKLELMLEIRRRRATLVDCTLAPNNGYAARRIHNLRAWAICEAERAHGIACCPARLCLAKLPRAGLVPSARSTKHPKLVYGVRGVHIRRNSVGWKLQPLKERFGGDGKVALHRWQQRRK